MKSLGTIEELKGKVIHQISSMDGAAGYCIMITEDNEYIAFVQQYDYYDSYSDVVILSDNAMQRGYRKLDLDILEQLIELGCIDPNENANMYTKVKTLIESKYEHMRKRYEYLKEKYDNCEW